MQEMGSRESNATEVVKLCRERIKAMVEVESTQAKQRQSLEDALTVLQGELKHTRELWQAAEAELAVLRGQSASPQGKMVEEGVGVGVGDAASRNKAVGAAAAAALGGNCGASANGAGGDEAMFATVENRMLKYYFSGVVPIHSQTTAATASGENWAEWAR